MDAPSSNKNKTARAGLRVAQNIPTYLKVAKTTFKFCERK